MEAVMATRREVTCIVPDGADKDRRIDSIGGTFGKLSLDDAIASIENRTYSYWTMGGGRAVDIIIAVRNGRKYLKTKNYGEEPSNLLSLPRCP